MTSETAKEIAANWIEPGFDYVQTRSALAIEIDDALKAARLTALQDAAKEICPWCALADGDRVHAADKCGQHWCRCTSRNHPDGHIEGCMATKIHALIEREGLK